MSMKTIGLLLALVLGMGLYGSADPTTDVRILSYSTDGILSWTNASLMPTCHVDGCSSLANSNWVGIQNIVVTSDLMAVSIPTNFGISSFFRISTLPVPDITIPSDISNFTATAGDVQVILGWLNPPDIDLQGVKILRKTGGYPIGITDGTVVYNSTGTNTTDTGLTNGTAYYYKAFSHDFSTNYANGVTATATPADLTPPANISGFTAVGSDSTISLSWTNPGDADFSGVKILRKIGSYPANTTDGSVVYNSTGTSTTNTGLANGTNYYYKAFSYDEVPNYSSGAIVTATPPIFPGTTFTHLHSFDSAANGLTAYAAPTISGSILYGMTSSGGTSNKGTVFTMNINGSGFAILHSFAGGTSDGSTPYGSLTLSGTTLYGMTPSGGAYNKGTIFKMNTDGSGYTLLRSFSATSTDGSMPNGSLTLSGSTLYGMTLNGGANGYGAIFKMNTDGSAFSLLRSFAFNSSSGYNPYDSLAISGSNLYGLVYSSSGSGNPGVAFRIDTNGTSYAIIHSFTNTVSDGRNPQGSLILSGSTFYGMTKNGGANGTGIIFKMNTDGSGFSLLHSFYGGVNDGTMPEGSLALYGSTLYGMTQTGGTGGGGNYGVLFKINTDGSGFGIVHNFAGSPSDGYRPHYGPPVFSGTTLYGLTEGSIYSLK